MWLPNSSCTSKQTNLIRNPLMWNVVFAALLQPGSRPLFYRNVLVSFCVSRWISRHEKCGQIAEHAATDTVHSLCYAWEEENSNVSWQLCGLYFSKWKKQVWLPFQRKGKGWISREAMPSPWCNHRLVVLLKEMKHAICDDLWPFLAERFKKLR